MTHNAVTCPQPITVGLNLSECGQPAKLVTTYGGEPFALICKTAGHITPQQRRPEVPKRCRTCGCRRGHATGCEGPEKNRRAQERAADHSRLAQTAEPPHVERDAWTEDCFDQMEIWALEMRPAYRSDSVPVKEYSRDAEPAIQAQLWYEWARRLSPRP